jgi:hypothetical protein
LHEQHDAVLAAPAELARLRRDYDIASDALTVADPSGLDQVQAAFAGRTGLNALVGPGVATSLKREDIVHLLAALRDRYCRRIRLVIPRGESEPALSRTDLLALGFAGPTAGPADCAVYVFDADEFNAPRDWNTPDDWAHPERFDKERW